MSESYGGQAPEEEAPGAEAAPGGVQDPALAAMHAEMLGELGIQSASAVGAPPPPPGGPSIPSAADVGAPPPPPPPP